MHTNNCHLKNKYDSAFYTYLCSTKPGESGGPLVVYVRRKIQFIGVHEGWDDRIEGNPNVAPSLAAFNLEIAEEYAADFRAHPGVPNVADVPVPPEGVELGTD